jgi:hypothetical protein
MRKTYFFVGGVLVLLGIAGAVRWPTSPGAPTRSRDTQAQRPPAPSPTNDGEGSGAIAEVQRLQAELRQKDRLLRALAAASAHAAEPAPSPAAEPTAPPPALDPAARTADILDERMLLEPKDPAKTAEMERALRSASDPAVLGEARVTSLYCGSTLCRVTIKADQENVANRSVSAMSSELPKLFGASRAFRLDSGERALYVAPSREALAVNLDDQNPR